MPKTILRDFALVLFLFALIPSIIIHLIGLPNGLISALIYMQLLIIWIQTELSLRQQILYKLQASPIITLSTSSIEARIINNKGTVNVTVTINVHNLGMSPAFNVMMSRVLKDIHTPISPSAWSKRIRCNVVEYLGYKEEKTLCTTTWSELKEFMNAEKFIFEVSYFDRYGDIHSVFFMVAIGEEMQIRIIPIPFDEKEFERIGVLLPRLTGLATYFKVRNIIRKHEKLKDNTMD